jgi:threonine aldolase
MLGGAMRQIGILAAACDYALTHNLARLTEDHDNARLTANHLAGVPGVVIHPERMATNIVVFELANARLSATELVARAREAGVLINALSATKVRLVTHLDASRADCERAAGVIADLLSGTAGD